MERILSYHIASITDLKKDPMTTVNQAQGEAVAILNRNQPVFYCLPVQNYEMLMDALDDVELGKLVKERAQEEEISVEWDDL